MAMDKYAWINLYKYLLKNPGFAFPRYIAPLENTEEVHTEAQESVLAPRICPCCGAPVRGDECDYCGSVFERKEVV